MNKDIIKGNWNQLKDDIQNYWRHLTNNEIDEIAGNTELLLGKLQEKYGYARQQAQKELDAFLDEQEAENDFDHYRLPF